MVVEVNVAGLKSVYRISNQRHRGSIGNNFSDLGIIPNTVEQKHVKGCICRVFVLFQFVSIDLVSTERLFETKHPTFCGWKSYGQIVL